jgi:hypothetical protein
MEASQEVRWVDVQGVLRGQSTEQVLVAQYIVNIGAVQGGAVNLAGRGHRADKRIRPRREPPHILPRAVAGFLDRSREQGLVGQALARGQVVDIHGPDGWGKTALTSQAMQAQLPSSFPDGMIYLSARHETREDLLQDLFETFFESDERVKVTENHVRRHMADKRALVAVDDANLLEEGEAEDLAQALPGCALLIAAREQQTWQGTSIPLKTLPTQHAVRLFEQQWGQVEAQDRPTVETICEAVGNVPLNIVKTARTALQQQLSLEQTLQQVRPRDKRQDPAVGALMLLTNQLSPQEQRVLGGLAAPGGSTVGIEALPVITGLEMEEIARHLVSLQERGLVYANSPRCSLDDGLRRYIEQAWTSSEMRTRAAEYFLAKAAALQRLPRDPDEENVLSALDHYFQRGQWQQVVTIVRSIDRYLASTGRWGQWRKRLEQALQAARNSSDQATEAWAQNQLGVIAMGVGEMPMAKRLFREALSIRRALSDRAGVVITRWNLRMLAPIPPTPWDRLLGKITSILQSGSLWLPMALVTVALLASTAVIVTKALEPTPTAVLSATLVPSAATLAPSHTPPQPTITLTPGAQVLPSLEVWLAAGCGETFAPGTELTIQSRSTVTGRVAIVLVDPRGGRSAPFEMEILAQEVSSLAWVVPEWPGNWTVEASLDDGQATARCTFAVETPSAVKSPPTPAVSVWLANGCGWAYRAGARAQISLQASISGQVTVYLVSPEGARQSLFSQPVQAGRTYARNWAVPKLAGNWTLAAVLNRGQATGHCRFTVVARPVPTREDAKPATPTVVITPVVEIELAGGCDRTYKPDSRIEIRLRANVEGLVVVSLVDPQGEPRAIFRQWLTRSAQIDEPWNVPETEGDWVLVAVLNKGQARDTCAFQVEDIIPVTPTEVISEVSISLAGGCNQIYEPGAWTEIRLQSNVGGLVVVYLGDPQKRDTAILRKRLAPGEESKSPWRVPETAGSWVLLAVLNGGQVRDRCAFPVKDATPVVTVTPTEVVPRVSIELAGGCGQAYEPGSKATVYFGANVNGIVTIWLDDTAGPSVNVTAGEIYEDVIPVAKEPGPHKLVAVLDERDASAECIFYVRETATITPTEAMPATVTPVPTTVTPLPEISPTIVPTLTPIPPMVTREPEPTAPVMPTATPTTVTPVPTTVTPPPEPSPTIVPTATPAPPTATQLPMEG